MMVQEAPEEMDRVSHACPLFLMQLEVVAEEVAQRLRHKDQTIGLHKGRVVI